MDSPFKYQPQKMDKHAPTIHRQLADKLFECAWPFSGVEAYRINYFFYFSFSTNVFYVIHSTEWQKILLLIFISPVDLAPKKYEQKILTSSLLHFSELFFCEKDSFIKQLIH